MRRIERNSWQRIPCSAKEFGAWLILSEPGEVLQYHEGLLVSDIEQRPGQSQGAARDLLALASLTYWAGSERMVHLLQYRLGPARFAYLVVRRVPAESGRAAGMALRLADAVDTAPPHMPLAAADYPRDRRPRPSP